MKEKRSGEDPFFGGGNWERAMVCLVCNTGPEITDELVKVLRKRLDETTLDIITIMLGRNCKLTPADVEVNYLMR